MVLGARKPAIGRGIVRRPKVGTATVQGINLNLEIEPAPPAMEGATGSIIAQRERCGWQRKA